MTAVLKAMADAVRGLDDATLVSLAFAFHEDVGTKPAPKFSTAQGESRTKPAAQKLVKLAPRSFAIVRNANAQEQIEAIERFIGENDGVSMGDILKATNIDRQTATRYVQRLKKEGRIFMGGMRRFARYATTKSAAEAASIGAGVAAKTSWQHAVNGDEA